MPSAVKTARDEHLWARAKTAAKKQGRAKDYAYVMGIFQHMKGGAKSMVDLLAGEDSLSKAITADEADTRQQLKRRAKKHRQRAEEHRRTNPKGGGTMGRWRQGQAHEDAQEAHREAAEVNEQAVTDASQRDEAQDASAAASTHQRADEVKSMKKAQGEGTRGGKVIGHTAAGKPIYASSELESLEAHNKARNAHSDKVDYHMKEARKLHPRFSFSPSASDIAKQKKAQQHNAAAEVHRRASGAHTDAGWGFRHLRDEGMHAEADNKTAEAKARALSLGKKAHQLSTALSSGEDSRAAKKSLDAIEEMDKLIKAACPGKIIGRTADGKEVYAQDEDKLQKEKACKKGSGSKAAQNKPQGGKQQQEDDEEGGEGTHGHHSARALAHLQAAQAHASAAHSAKKVDEAKEHKNVVSEAGKMSEAAMADTKKKVEKSMGELSKAIYPNSDVTGWAGQFYGTPMYVDALECIKEKIALDKRRELAYSKQKKWSELREMGQSARAAEEKKQADQMAPLDRQRDELRAKQSGLEEKLLDHKIQQAKALNKSDDAPIELTPEGLREDLNKSIVTMLRDMQQPTMARKNNLEINMSAENAVLDVLEKGGGCLGRQAAGMQEDRRHSLLGMRGERLQKGGVAGGTIYQGEHDAGGSRGGDDRESVARAQVYQEMTEIDDAGMRGNGGLPEWFKDSYVPAPGNDVRVPVGMGPKATGWAKSSDEAFTVVDDDDPYTRAIHKGGQHGEHQSAIRQVYQGSDRQQPK